MEAEWKSGESQRQGVIFDLDGVLVDSSQFHFEAWQAWAEEAGLEERVTRDWFRATFGRRNADVFHTLYDHDLSPEDVQRQSDRKERLFRERARGRLRPLAGARDLVATLHDADYRLALGTSAPRANATMMIEELGLSPFFDAQVTGDDVATGKPDPEVFRTAAQRLGVQPKGCLVIEDAAAGVEAAHRAGMAAVAVTDQPTEGHRRAERVVRSLVELTVATITGLIRDNVSGER